MSEFGPRHYTRDWDLLACICSEWTEIRTRFRLGARATREQIEDSWDAIFNADRSAWPCIRRVFQELMQDQALKRHLRRCYWALVREGPWAIRGYTFTELLPVVLFRAFLTVVRNACKWLDCQGKLEHWARFWNDRSLTEELRRAIGDMWESEGPCDSPLPDNF